VADDFEGVWFDAGMNEAAPEMTLEERRKSILRSKTFWVQVVAMLGVLVPAVQEWLAANPVEFVAVLVAVNVLIRFATSGAVTLFGAQEDPKVDEDDERSGPPGGAVPLALLACTAVALLGSPSPCSGRCAETQDGKTQDARGGGKSTHE
jgi:hypothetical protein